LNFSPRTVPLAEHAVDTSRAIRGAYEKTLFLSVKLLIFLLDLHPLLEWRVDPGMRRLGPRVVKGRR